MGIPGAAGRQRKTYTVRYIYKNPCTTFQNVFLAISNRRGKKSREFQFAPEILQNIIYTTVLVL